MAACDSKVDTGSGAATKPIRVLIVGGGVGGFTVAQGLKQACEKDLVKLTIVDATNEFQLGAGYQFALTGRSKVEHFTYRKSDYNLDIKNLTCLWNTPLVSLDMAKKAASVRREGGVVSIPFDFLVLAMGVQSRKELVPGLKDSRFRDMANMNDVLKLRADLEAIESGDVVVSIAGMPYKCPPAPFEFAFLIDEMLKKRGIRDKVAISFAHPKPFPFGSPAVAKAFLTVCKEKNIRMLPNHVVKSISSEGGKSTLHFKGDQPSVKADVLLGMTPQRAPDCLKDLLHPMGFVDAHPVTMRAVKHPDCVYALGDCSIMFLDRKTPDGKPVKKPHPKAGVFAMLCAQTVAQQLVRIAQGASVADAASAVPVGRQSQCLPEAGGDTCMFLSPKLFADKDGPPGFRVELPQKKHFTAKVDWINSTLGAMFKDKSRPFPPKMASDTAASKTSGK